MSRVGRRYRKSPYSNFSRGWVLGATVIRLSSGPLICSPPRLLLPRRTSASSSHDFYVPAYLGLFPPRAGDMLAVRYRATDGRGTCTLLDSQPCRLLPAHTQNSPFSGLWFRFRAYTLHLVILAYLPFQLTPSGHYTSERLTKPYSGELPAFAALSQLANIARLPGHPVPR